MQKHPLYTRIEANQKVTLYTNDYPNNKIVLKFIGANSHVKVIGSGEVNVLGEQKGSIEFIYSDSPGFFDRTHKSKKTKRPKKQSCCQDTEEIVSSAWQSIKNLFS